MRESKPSREIDHLLRDAKILGQVAGATVIDQPSCADQHLFDDASGDGAFSKVLQDQLAFMVRQRDQPEQELMGVVVAYAGRIAARLRFRGRPARG